MSPIKKTIYNVANEVDTYRNQLNNDPEEIFMNMEMCRNFVNPYINKVNADLNCERAIKYLSYLKSFESLDFRDQGFRYMCYWIYYDVLNDKKSFENTLNLYKEFHRKYEEFDDHKFDEYLKQFSTYMLENLIKLTDLYKMFNAFKGNGGNSCTNHDQVQQCAQKYNTYVDECYSGDDDDFCDELENFKQTYENYMKTSTCPETIPKILPPIKRHNIGATVSIPFAIILVVSFFLFILYKFTPFGLRVSSLLKRKKTMYNDLEKDKNEFVFTSKKADVNSENKKYSLSYHSVE
ncbi:PIR Superfamily Protein [Plasmodium ovale curtisi]|uniref:PIR Superfamily Protein n=1 Tax=Plasmodium ovale curtisi TaxID=864141 RepID=A0A1A8WP80_PLAOA|nr:PIR Superfamily Protein [Plasmodium ovale curtisi]